MIQTVQTVQTVTGFARMIGTHDATQESDLFASARWYDLSINWEARLNRELPVLQDVFGPPGDLGLLDAACGTGRHITAMVAAGYRVTGVDLSDDMLAVARKHLAEQGVTAPLIRAAFDAVPSVPHRFDGIYCLGNSLAATGSAEAARGSLAALASVLCPGGRLFVQILNFEKLRTEKPALRGPRVTIVNGVEYVSLRLFSFRGNAVEVTNVTMWKDQTWRQHAGTGSLYAISGAEMTDWCRSSGLQVDALYGNYARQPFDTASSNDLIVVATRTD
jgi:SAM-dependent methyltransferase